MNKQKGLAPILIVILIALAVGGYLFIQKQNKSVPVSQPSLSPITSPVASNSADISNWKTYTNIKYGFSFKYPSDLEQLTNTSYPGGSIQKLIVDMSRNVQKIPGTPDYYKDSLLIDIYQNKENLSLTGYTQKILKDTSYLVTQAEVKIDGQVGIKQTLKGDDSVIYFVKLSHQNPILTIYYKEGRKGSFESDFNQILSTFKFTP